MGTPITDNPLYSLIPHRKITWDEWLELCEMRRRIIKPHLRSFNTYALGETRCLRDDLLSDFDFFTGSLQGEGRFQAPPHLLEMRGVYHPVRPPRRKDEPPDLKQFHIFGLDRLGNWILVKVEFVVSGNREWTSRVSGGVSQLVSIANESGVHHPRGVWIWFERVVNDWYETRRSYFEEAERLAKEIYSHNHLISAVEEGM